MAEIWGVSPEPNSRPRGRFSPELCSGFPGGPLSPELRTSILRFLGGCFTRTRIRPYNPGSCERLALFGGHRALSLDRTGFELYQESGSQLIVDILKVSCLDGLPFQLPPPCFLLLRFFQRAIPMASIGQLSSNSCLTEGYFCSA